VLAAVLAGGCGEQSQWKERLAPPSTAVQVVRIESDRPDVRREALQAVTDDSAARKVPSIVKLFCLVARTDKDSMVRSAAVRGLGAMTGDEVVPTLAQVVTKDDSPYVRCDAAVALGRQTRPGGAAALAQALQGDSKADVRMAAAEALRQFRDKPAATALVAALKDPSLAVSQKAWESLRYMTGQNMPREAQPWEDFFASAEKPFDQYGRPPAMPKGENQRPQFTKGPMEFIRDLFAKDVREAELQ
jgi:hypothetical protein